MTAHTRRFITAIFLCIGLVIAVAAQNEIAGVQAFAVVQTFRPAVSGGPGGPHDVTSGFSQALVAAAAQTPDPQSLGPKVGERVPEFSLPDQHRTMRSLRSTLGPKGAVLVFFRSADW